MTPSAKWISRQWDKENWIELAGRIQRQFGAQILVLGKDDETLPVGVDLVGKTGVREAAAIISQCHLFVGADSGLVHVALACGTPVVGLYGPLNPAYLSQPRPAYVPVWADIECRGCWSDGRMKFPDHCPKVAADCMPSISVEEVMAACKRMLSLSTARGVHAS